MFFVMLIVRRNTVPEEKKEEAQKPIVPEREPDQENAEEEVEHKTPREVWIAIAGVILFVIVSVAIFIPAILKGLSK